MHEIEVAELRDHLASVSADDAPTETRLLVVAGQDQAAELDEPSRMALATYPGVSVGVHGAASGDLPAPDAITGCDVLLTEGKADGRGWVTVPDVADAVGRLRRAIEQTPVAARVCVDVLRHAGGEIEAGLVAESTAYSALLGGPEFHRWLGSRAVSAHRPGERPPVRVETVAGAIHIVLDRPHVHNAFDAATREALTDALIACWQAEGTQPIVLRGEGPSFCSGGDLSEFGTAADPATAHLVRTTRGAGRWLARLSGRITARVHGTCVGAGVELPAFAGRVEATADATFRLPELEMGLIPGAGGTVSVTGRIGRHRSTWLTLTGTTLDAATARLWGLVDAII